MPVALRSRDSECFQLAPWSSSDVIINVDHHWTQAVVYSLTLCWINAL